MRGREERESKRDEGRESGTSLSSWWRWRDNRTLLYYSSNKTIYTNRGRCHQHSWWLAPLIFHLILYICFYDLPANRNTQRESRSVMVDCAISSAGAGCRETKREWAISQPQNIPSFTSACWWFSLQGAPLLALTAPRDSHYLQFWLFTCFPFYALTHKVSVVPRN